jgi:hypothetical protein
MTAVDNAEAAATSAICGQVRPIVRSRLSITR